MSNDNRRNGEVWLKVLVGLLIMLIIGSFGYTRVSSGKLEGEKLDVTIFEQHERYQATQYDDIKGFLERIENKLP